MLSLPFRRSWPFLLRLFAWILHLPTLSQALWLSLVQWRNQAERQRLLLHRLLMLPVLCQFCLQQVMHQHLLLVPAPLRVLLETVVRQPRLRPLYSDHNPRGVKGRAMRVVMMEAMRWPAFAP